jgi:hypothetical protein
MGFQTATEQRALFLQLFPAEKRQSAHTHTKRDDGESKKESAIKSYQFHQCSTRHLFCKRQILLCAARVNPLSCLVTSAMNVI